jgi:hypothetical protein
MRLSLYISKKSSNNHTQRDVLVFTVVDLDRGASYPQNFVCLLPRIRSPLKSESVFSSMFGDQSLQVAKKLLNRALKAGYEAAIVEEIEQRLKDLQPKPVRAACIRCGTMFEAKICGKNRQKICSPCKNKNKVSQRKPRNI